MEDPVGGHKGRFFCNYPYSPFAACFQDRTVAGKQGGAFEQQVGDFPYASAFAPAVQRRP